MAARMPAGASSSKKPEPPTEIQPDEIIGEFKRGKEIGKGSFATVYLAQHRVSFSSCNVVSIGVDTY